MSARNWILLISAVIITGLVVRAKKDNELAERVANTVSVEQSVVGATCKDISADDDWALFIDALAWVESGWNTQALGTKKDVGWLQLTPIMVADANEILGAEYCTLDDRYFKEKSIEIFNVVMNERNPDRDKHFALKIWNPKAPVSYHTKVMDKYYELLNNYYYEDYN